MRFLTGLVACFAAAVTHAAVPEAQSPADAGAAPTAIEEPTASEEPWVSASGSGLLSLQDTSTLAKKHLNLDIAFDNQDRDPLRLDVIDYSVAWNYGIRSGLETYGHIVVSRAVSVGDRSSLFAPPADIILPEGTPVPRPPYHLLYAQFPYVSRQGRSRLSNFVPGDAVLGGKLRLLTPRDRRPGLAATLELKVPMTRELASLQSGAGTGGFDQTLRLTGEWRTRRQSFVAATGITHVGQPALSDQLIVFSPEGAGKRIELPFRLANRIHLGLGFRHLLRPSVALVAEVTKVVEFGGHTPAYEAPGALDITVGSQLRWRSLHLSLGVRHHANSVPALGTSRSPFGGMVDLTTVAQRDRVAYLSAIGAGIVVPYLRDRAQIAAVVPADGPPLPEGARLLPMLYAVRSHGQIESTLVFGWSFGRARKKWKVEKPDPAFSATGGLPSSSRASPPTRSPS